MENLKEFFNPNIIKRKVFIGQDFFMPKRKEEDPILKIKEVLFIQSSYLLFVFNLLLGFYEIYIGFILNAITSFSLAFMLLVLLFYLKSGVKIYIVGFFQIILIWLKIFILLVETGGFNSNMLLWLMLPILLATIYLSDALSILLWVIFSVISLIIIYYLTIHNWLITHPFVVKNYEWVYNLSFGILFILIILLYNNERKLYQFNLTTNISLLEIQKEELRATIEELKIQNEKIKSLNAHLEDKQKIIENQLTILKTFSKARAEAAENLKKQKAIVERVLRDLEDSLKFAQILQNLFLPNINYLQQSFPYSFLIFKQKQFVGGDFYYFYTFNKHKILLIVGDCTGHGPAGGIMSAITMIFLKEFINEGVYQPRELIDKLRRRVKGIFVNVQNSHLIYGLEIAVALIDKQASELYFTGAHLPFILFRRGHLLEISTDNSMIGDMFPFDRLHQVKLKLEKGDRIFIFTDGYYSQLNPEYIKLSKAKFKKILWSTSFEDINLQKIVLEQALNDWKKFVDQTDDITILGIKID